MPKDNSGRQLPPPPLRSTMPAAMPHMAPSTSDNGFITIQGQKSQDKRPRDPSKDPTPQQRPSKASRSPLPFPLKSESERVASVHTIFKAALSQDRPSSEWVYDCLKKFFPCKTTEQLVYFSNVLCLSNSEFHLTSICSPPGMCVPVLPPVVEAELPLLKNYLHEGELEAQDVRICCVAAIKRLGVWLHWVNMTTRYNEARANSPCSDDHKLGTLLDFLLMPENTGVSSKHIFDWVVVKNVDALEMRLVKSKKLLKDVSKAQTKLLTRLTKQKMTLEKTHLSKKVRNKTSKALSQTTAQLDQARTTVTQHTADIMHIEALLEDCESADEESSSSRGSIELEPGAEDPPATSPQDWEEEDPHDIEMKDVEDDPNPPPLLEQDNNLLPVLVQAAQSDPPHRGKEDREGMRDDSDVIVEDERIIIKAGGTTPITLAEDQLLDDQVGTGAKTLSRVVTESLSRMNMDSPATLQVANEPPDEGQDT